MCSESTITKQAGRSLDERAVMFHRRFPEVRISRQQLRSIYKLHGIKKKAIRQRKFMKAKD